MRTGHKIIAYSRQGRTRQWRDRTVQHGLSRPGGTWRCRHSRCPSPLSGPGPADLPDLCQPWYDLGGPAGLLTVPGTRPATSPLPALPTARAGQVLPACSDRLAPSRGNVQTHAAGRWGWPARSLGRGNSTVRPSACSGLGTCTLDAAPCSARRGTGRASVVAGMGATRCQGTAGKGYHRVGVTLGLLHLTLALTSAQTQ